MSIPPSGSEGDAPQHWGTVPELRGLRRLVIVLTTTLSLGVLTVAAALVIRIMQEPAPVTAPLTVGTITADAISLPSNEVTIASGATSAALTLITRDDQGQERIRVFDPRKGSQIGVVLINR